MKFFNLALLGLSLPLVAGHTLMTTLYIDGENQGDGVCIRQNRNPEKATYPIAPLANDAMACGYNGETASSRICPAPANATLTFEFREYPDGSQGGSIDPSHKGPCAVYMKSVSDASSDNNAAGEGWFKIYELDYDSSSGGVEWCTEKLIANNGFLSVDLPMGLKGGDYLVRTELLALHAAMDEPADPQFYVGCAQVFLDGSTGGAQPEGVVIDASTYDLGVEGLTYNIYEEELKPYPSFGPAVYKPANSAKLSSAGAGQQALQKKGLEPEGCILVRDDWCGFEVPAYSDEEGCWASSKKCWDQADVCWNTSPPTGNKACQIWQDKCSNIDDQCGDGNWSGPPNQGKVLTPELKGVEGDVEAFAGGVSSVQFEGSETEVESQGDGGELTGTAAAGATETTEATATVDAQVKAVDEAEGETEATPKPTHRPHRGGRCKARRSHL